MKRRRSALVIAIIAVVLLVGGALTFWLLARPSGPATTVAAYLSALERGDGAAASALSASPRGGQGEGTAEAAPLLGAAPLFDALDGASAWITESRTDSLATQGVDATATVSFALAGARHSATFTLSNTSGSWRVTHAPAATVQVRSTLGAGVVLGDVALGGVAVPFDDSESVTAVLLPGVYAVTPAPATFLEGTQTLAVTGTAPQEVMLEPSLSAAAFDAAGAEFARYLEQCTAPTIAVPSSCGIRVPWAADLAALTELKFRIDAAPEFSLAPDGSGFTATGGTLVATATGVDDGGAEASFTYRDSDWAVRGSVGFTIDGLTLEVW